MIQSQCDPRLNPTNRYVTVADGLTLPRDVAARYRSWTAIAPRPTGGTRCRYFRAFDDHLHTEVFIKATPVSPLPATQRAETTRAAEGGTTNAASTASSGKCSPVPADPAVDDRLDRQRIKLLQQLKHPRVAPFHQGIATSRWLISIAPLLTGGTLLDALRRRVCDQQVPLTEQDVAVVIRSVVQGIAHLHNEGLVYGSLHPLTLLYPTTDGDGAGGMGGGGGLSALKLTSFRGAFAAASAVDATTTTTTRGFRSMLDVEAEGWWHGSIPFLAPEAVARIFGGDAIFSAHRQPTSELRASATATEDSRISTQSDMWAVGVLAYLLLTGTFPMVGRDHFMTMQRIHQVGFSKALALRTMPFTWPPASLTPEALAACTSSAERMYREVLLARGSEFAPALAFIESCCRYAPGERMTAAEALRHPWLTEGVEEQQTRALPPAAQTVYCHPAVATSSAPQPLGRYRQWLQAYVNCAVATGTRLNSGVLAMMCEPGPWAARTHIAIRLAATSCGSLGCACVLRSLLDVLEAAADERPTPNFKEFITEPQMTTTTLRAPKPFPYRLTELDMRGCDLADESIQCMVDLLMERGRSHAAASLHTWRLDDNARITHQGARHVLRMLSAAQERHATEAVGANMQVVSLYGTHVGAHLKRRLEALLGA